MSTNISTNGTEGERRCPSCNSEQVATIVYGLPSPKLFEEADKGRVVLGGCVECEGNPEWKCKACKHAW